MAKPAITIEGARTIRRQLKAVGAAKEVRVLNKAVAEIPAQTAGRLINKRTGRMGRSIKGYGLQTGAEVRSNHPGAGVIEYGWPRRGIKAQAMVRRAIGLKFPAMLKVAEEIVAKSIRRAGFNG